MHIPRTLTGVIGIGAFLISAAVHANQAPSISPLDDVTVFLNEPVRFRVVPTDPDGVVPALRVVNPPTRALFSDNGDGTRTFEWLPGDADVGVNKITFEVLDALNPELRDALSMNVNVVDNGVESTEKNRLTPSFASLNNASVLLGSSFDFRVVPHDPSGQVPALRAAELPRAAGFTDNRDGTRQFQWTPDASQVGEHKVTFIVSNETNPELQTAKTIVLSVLAQTDTDDGIASATADIPEVELSSPAADQTPSSDQLNEDEQHHQNAQTEDDSAKLQFVALEDQFVYLGQQLQLLVQVQADTEAVPGIVIDKLPLYSSFNDNGDGSRTLRWYPYPNDLGDTFVTFTATNPDKPQQQISKTVKITVARDPGNPINFPPSINGMRNPIIRAGDTLRQRVKPTDPDNTVPGLVVLNSPANADFIDNGDGSREFHWPTNDADLGEHQIQFRAIDSDDPLLQFDTSITVSVLPHTAFERDGARLRDLASSRDILVGFAAVLNSRNIADNELYRHIAGEEFNIVTPENSHKMSWIQPRRGEFRWDDSDDLANFATEKNMVLHGHPLVWYAQLPDWVRYMDPTEAQTIMTEHINALVGRYRGRVAVWDVVNEAINDVDGKLRGSIWFRGMGRDYIARAFHVAKAADPDAVLIYNDYDVAWPGVKSDAMYALLEQELAAGTPIDGVGFQMHLRSDFNDFDGVEQNFQRFADLGLSIYITEFDVALDADGEEQLQASIYKRVMEICLQQPACKAIQTWGFTDRYSWRSRFSPLLLDSTYSAKPAYTAWQEALENR